MIVSASKEFVGETFTVGCIITKYYKSFAIYGKLSYQGVCTAINARNFQLEEY